MHRGFRGIVPLNSSSKSLELFDLIVTNHDLVRSRVQIKGAMVHPSLDGSLNICIQGLDSSHPS